MLLQDQSNKEGIPTQINPFNTSNASTAQMINVVDQATESKSNLIISPQ